MGADNETVLGSVAKAGEADRDCDGGCQVPPCASADFIWSAGGQDIAYTACAGHIEVVDDEGVLEGQMFSISYLATAIGGEEVDRALRPVTFCYNGGPGSASVPINFGGIGPLRVDTRSCDFADLNPQVRDNPGTLLVQSDLVFLDALGCGWSFVAPGYGAERVYGLEEDARTFCRAIVRWLDDNDRWGSPIYIFGESYGTMRSAVLMRYLGEAGVPLTGVVMLSAYFDWTQTQPGNDLGYIGLLPSYAATAQYFGLVARGFDWQVWYTEAYRFAETEYAQAIMAGDRITEDRRRNVAEKMAGFIGIEPDYLEAHNLRLELEDFRRELLKDEGLACGRLDMRFTEHRDLPIQNGSFFFACEDPASHAVETGWYGAFRDFLGRGLGYRNPAPYRLNVWSEIGRNWDWRHDEPGCDTRAHAPNLAFDLAVALRRNPRMKIAILGGAYDAATPWWNVVHTISCLYLPRELKKQIEFHVYPCGHMAYVDEPTLAKMASDLGYFYSD